MVDLNDPAAPAFAGCFADDGYTHDAQCVVYDGPDNRFTGREICFNSNEDTLTIVDVTDKSDPTMLSRVGYDGSAYSHQGWLTEDGSHFLMGDGFDEPDRRQDLDADLGRGGPHRRCGSRPSPTTPPRSTTTCT